MRVLWRLINKRSGFTFPQSKTAVGPEEALAKGVLYEVRLIPSGKWRVQVPKKGIALSPHIMLSWVGQPRREGFLPEADYYVIMAWVAQDADLEAVVDDVVLGLAADGVFCSILGRPLQRGETGNQGKTHQIIDGSRSMRGQFGRNWDPNAAITRVAKLSSGQLLALRFAHAAGSAGLDANAAAVLLCSSLEALVGSPPGILSGVNKQTSAVKKALTSIFPAVPSLLIDRLVNRVADAQQLNAQNHAIAALNLSTEDARVVRKLYAMRNATAHGGVTLFAGSAPHPIVPISRDVREGIELIYKHL